MSSSTLARTLRITSTAPTSYFLDVFSANPGGDDPWGVKLDGHHLAL